MADQICYAVLCVFSYFAAGQEQKKAILEQASRLPPPPSTLASLSPGSTSPLPPGGNSPKGRLSPQVEKRSASRSGESRGSFSKEPTVPVDTGQPPGRTPPDLRSSRQPAVRDEPDRPPPEPSKPARAPPDSPNDVCGVKRTDSLPPRRPPPPAPLQQRLSRAHSTAAPSSLGAAREPDLPALPPRVVGVPRPVGPPPALPPRQFSAAADFSSGPRSVASPPSTRALPEVSAASPAGARRMPQRAGSISAPFAPTNPFAPPRHAEFVIPARGARRASTTDRS